MDSLCFKRMSKSSCSSMPLRKRRHVKLDLTIRKHWEVQYSLGVLYRCLVCKLGSAVDIMEEGPVGIIFY